MGYPDGGELMAAERARREQVRLAAAELIEAGTGAGPRRSTYARTDQDRIIQRFQAEVPKSQCWQHIWLRHLNVDLSPPRQRR
jgi:hypothetical protein